MSGGELAQLGDHEADVVPGAAHDGMDRIAERALERVSGQAAVHLHVADGGLDGASAPDHGPERAGDAALLARAQDAHAVDLGAAVALVDDGRGGLVLGEDGDLLDRLVQGVAVVGVAGHGAHAHDEAFPERGGQADLGAELVGRPGLALADALDLGCVQGVELVFVLRTLGKDAAGTGEQLAQPGLGRLAHLLDLASHLAVHAPDAAAQRAQRCPHAPELPGMGVAADLRGQPRARCGRSSGASTGPARQRP